MILFKYCSNHIPNQIVDEVFSVSPVSSSLEGVPLLSEPSPWGSQLERPQKIVSLLEVGANSIDLVDQIFEGNDSVFA